MTAYLQLPNERSITPTYRTVKAESEGTLLDRLEDERAAGWEPINVWPDTDGSFGALLTYARRDDDAYRD